MSNARVFLLTALAMTAFAGNSLLCRMALRDTAIDAASFTSLRLLSGALVLWLMARFFAGPQAGKGNWLSAFALFAYAACFSFAYLSLSAATGALLLFGAVQASMIGYGIWVGERLSRRQLLGLVSAFGGLLSLFLPGLSAPPLFGALLMLVAGVAWGGYSLLGKKAGSPIKVSAGNFSRSVLLAALLSAVMVVFMPDTHHFDSLGVIYAVASGALASGAGYALWYSVLPSLRATHAATVQLSVPVITAIGGVVFLSEDLTLRLVLASIAILGGIALVILKGHSETTITR